MYERKIFRVPVHLSHTSPEINLEDAVTGSVTRDTQQPFIYLCTQGPSPTPFPRLFLSSALLLSSSESLSPSAHPSETLFLFLSDHSRIYFLETPTCFHPNNQTYTPQHFLLLRTRVLVYLG